MSSRSESSSPEPRVLHVDNHVLMLAKPAGMPCVPDDTGDFSLLDWGKDWIAREFKKPGAVFLGVVHRLDRPVSGVVAFARTSKGAARLGAAFRDKLTSKLYWAVLSSAPQSAEGTVRHSLLKDRARNRVSVVSEGTPDSKEAHSTYRVLERKGARALVVLSPVTGRSHQLRVAMASLGVPICGDLRYGAEEPLSDKSIALHAFSLTVPHPTLDQTVHGACGPPELAIWDWNATRVFARELVKDDGSGLRDSGGPTANGGGSL